MTAHGDEVRCHTCAGPLLFGRRPEPTRSGDAEPAPKQIYLRVTLPTGNSEEAIFGYPDDLKFRSCMTLFTNTSDNQIFVGALSKYFKGKPDPATIERL